MQRMASRMWKGAGSTVSEDDERREAESNSVDRTVDHSKTRRELERAMAKLQLRQGDAEVTILAWLVQATARARVSSRHSS